MGNASCALLSLMLNSCKHDCLVNVRATFFSDPDSSPADIPVSLDGSWKSRRMDSRHGVVASVSADTGEVLDRHYLCSRCAACAMWSGREDTDEYMDWWGEHASRRDTPYTHRLACVTMIVVDALASARSQAINNHHADLIVITGW